MDGCLDVTDTFHGDAILVVAVNVLILEFGNLVDEDTQFVGDIGNILIAGLTPKRKLLLGS